ncbi:uncharacterized protein LOC119720779 [Patiria miniata]|uniref:Uncharacterized protein n=1 Tax=Patiria miniata TaxID=46514 RepID=A0A913Z4A0_PATMI|nr:uncharacterized protein LOC119720779 [Patiria miniata]XP_038046547.1 uncharacterized protein LOC119720779 [Patiria miniata]
MTDKTDRDCTPVPSGDGHIPGKLGVDCAPSQSGTTSDIEWLQQSPERYQFMQATDSPLLLRLQGTQLTNTVAVAPRMIPPRMMYPRGLLPAIGHQGAVPLGVFPPASTRQAPASLSCISRTGVLPASHFALDSISSTQEAVPQHVGPSSHLLDHARLQDPTAVKQEMPLTGSGQYYRSLLDAKVRMHLSELCKIQQLQYLLDHHVAQQRSLPELPVVDISSEAQQPLDLNCSTVSNSNNILVTLKEQTPESQDRILHTETNLELSCVPPASLESHQDQETSEIDSEEEITSSVLDMCPKKKRNTCTTELVNVVPELYKSVIRTPELQQNNRVVSWETTLPQNPLPSLPPDTSLRHSHSLNLLQQPIMKPQSGLVTQGGRPLLPLVHPDLGTSLAIEKGVVPEMYVEASFRKTNSSDEDVPEHVLSLVAEVGCSSKRNLDTITKSTSGKLHQSLNPLPREKSMTMGSCSDINPLPPDLSPVPNKDIVEDVSVSHASLKNKPASVETKPVAQEEQSQVPESKTIITELDFRKQPPVDNKCPICGDRVSGYHYGMYSCESCKGFFKRTIHSKRHEKLKCTFGGGCLVDLRSRKQCAACRFQKCLSLGMKLEAIRRDRQRGGRSLYEGSSEQRRLIKIKEEQATQSPVPKKRKQRQPSNHVTGKISSTCSSSTGNGGSKAGPSSVSPCMSEPGPSRLAVKTEPKSPGLPQLIQELVEQEKVFIHQSVGECCLSTLREEKNLLETICHFVNHQMLPLVKWAKGLPMYRQLVIEDQIRLLHKNVLSILCLNAIFYCLDHAGRLLLPKNQVIDLTTFNAAKFHQLVPKVTSIADQLHTAGLDLPAFVCLKLILLLSPDAPMVQSSEQVQAYQETAQEVFFDHITHAQPGNSRALGNLMLGLAAIERIAQQLNQETVWDVAVVERTFRHEEDVCSDRPCIRYRVL